MGEIPQPEPSAQMQNSFDVILANFKEEVRVKRNPVGEWLNMIHEYWSLQAQPASDIQHSAYCDRSGRWLSSSPARTISYLL